MKLNIAVFFGGKSCEHDVSIVTGLQAIENAQKDKYNVIPVYVSRDGEMHIGDSLKDIKFLEKFDKTKVKHVDICYGNKKGVLKSEGSGVFSKGSTIEIDAAILCFHGMNGEDGTIQGQLEMCNISYSSSGVLGASVGMDKIAMKIFFKGLGLPVLDGLNFVRSSFQSKKDEIEKQVAAQIGYPVYVKPANLGSSIGISEAKDKASLISALEVAFSYDNRVLVEKGLTDFVEINCSVLGYGDDVKASLCEQPVSWDTFLTFDEKYLRGAGSKGMKSLNRIVPAPISDELTKSIQDMSIEVFTTLNCKGVIRIDYVIDNTTSKLYINEINTIPGSLAYYLWEPCGVPFSTLIDKLIEFAIIEHSVKQKNVFAYDSNILGKFSGGSKGSKG